MRKIKCGLRTLIFCDVIAYDIAKLLYHLEFVSIQMKKFPETCNSWSSKLTQRQKLSVFWPRGQFGGWNWGWSSEFGQKSHTKPKIPFSTSTEVMAPFLWPLKPGIAAIWKLFQIWPHLIDLNFFNDFCAWFSILFHLQMPVLTSKFSISTLILVQCTWFGPRPNDAS